MQEKHEWEERYGQKKTPWDTGRPDSHLVRLVATWPKTGGRVLEVGCGTGATALRLAPAVRTLRATAQQTEGYVREHPWTSIGLGAAVGMLIGLLMGRR